jgi:4-azaleucine resistance transporter AzlC
MMTERTRYFLAGIRAEFPLLVGVFPFGLIYGALALSAGFTPMAAQAMSSILFAGSSQFLAAQMVATQTPALVVVLAVAVVNLRHALYSASIAPYLRPLNSAWKSLLAYLLTDEAYAAVITRYSQDGPTPHSHWFFLGAGLSLWTTWQVSTAIGIGLGTVIPSSWPLDFALPLTFIAMLVPSIKDRPALAAAIVAGLVGIITYPLPYKLGILLAAAAGILAGLLMEDRS